jgi:ABC-type glycerol-3-phosphate transport system substrate-binding protein
MRRIQWLNPLVLILVAAVVLIGCQAPAPTATPEPTKAPAPTATPKPAEPTKAPKAEPVQIEFWTDWAPEGAQGVVLQALLDDFNASQDEVFVTNVFMGGKRKEKITAGVAAGAPPDVAWDASAGENYYEEDLLVPMSRVYEVIDRDDFIPGLVAGQAYLGKEIAIPFENSNLAVYYNKDMLDEKGVEYPPAEVGAWTWSDFVEMAKLFSDPDQGQFGFHPNWSGAMLHSMIWEGGSTMLSSDMKSNLLCSDPKTRDIAIKSLQRLHDFAWESKITANDVGDMGFGSGDMAFAISGPWDMPRYKESSPDLNIGVASFPADEETGLAISYWYQKALLVFRTDEEHEEATLKFLKWFYSPEIHARWCAGAGYLPITKSAVEHDIWQNYVAEQSYVQVFLDQAPLMKRRPVGLPRADWATMIDAARLGEATPAEAVDAYCETAQELLDEFWAQPHR